ncbi:MAG TPA: alpha/beta hydrolase-fold protein, partial [Gemmataceae bacterium]|nr:alpha/beta hydrolase-fold protein [Gemmataceae bacterium]
MTRLLWLSLALLGAAWTCFAVNDPPRPATALRFEVTVARGLLDAPRDGRLLIVLGRKKSPEPRFAIGETGMSVPPLLGRDVKGFGPGITATVDQAAAIFPIASLGALPAGDYFVQAVLDGNPDFKLPDAPGNLYSEPVAAKLDPARGGTVKITLTRRVPAEQPPKETEQVKYVKVRSELLSRFWGRPIDLRAGVLLPRDFARDKDRRYPLRVRIGGYGTRYTAVGDLMDERSRFRGAWLADGAPRMVLLHLDGAGPYGDPYQVNSANNGPYGDAVTRELIPYVEKRFRCVGRPYARVVDGHSTGGWVSLALQVFYPDFFNGAWSHAPDPVDFRAYELI